jgi:putative ABC transport system permease protein
MDSTKLTFRFLRWFCPDHLYEEIEGDLIQRFNRDLKSSDHYRLRRAKWRMLWNVIRFFRLEILMRNKFTMSINQTTMFQNYFKTTYRHFLKSKANFVFKLSGLVLALFSFLIIALYVSFQLSFDKHNDGFENIYRLNTERKENGKQEKYGIAPSALGGIMHDKFPEIKAYARMQIANGSHLKYGDKVVSCGVFPADSSLFDVFTFHFLEGNKEALSKPGSITITKSIATKLFGLDNALEKIVTLEKKPYQVTAVVEDMPPNSHFRVDAFIPIFSKEDFTINNISSPVDFVDHSSVLYIKFQPNMDAEAFTAKLESLLDNHVSKKDREEFGFRIFLQPLQEIYLDEPFKYEFTKKGSMLYLTIFLVLGFFLLLSAIISYINLSIADFSGRAREIGVRKVMGARAREITFQISIETIFYVIVSLLLSVVLLYLLFPTVANTLEPYLTFSMLADRPLIISTLVTLLILLLLAIGIPAYWLSTSKTATDLKGSKGFGAQTTLSKSLLASQFIISIICISATIVVSKQMDFIRSNSLGIDKKNLLVLTMPEDFSVGQMITLKEGLKSLSGVNAVSNSSFRMGGGIWKDWYTAEVNGEMKSLELFEVFSDDQLFKTLGMKIIDGRTFNSNTPADSGAAFVINETAVKELGWKDPIGKRIFTHPEENGKWDGTVVGIVGDINIGSLRDRVQPLVMRLPWQNDWPEYFVYVRFDGKTAAVLSAIERKYKELLPGYPLEYDFVDEFYNGQYQKEARAHTSLQFGTIVIILISSLGIFSLSIYMSIRRMKEFGIRKVLGATAWQIIFLHVGHFLKIILFANLVALPVSYFLMKEWLDGFAYRTGLNGLIFVFVALISVLLIIVSAGYSSWRAGRMNPVDVIKME